MPRGLSIATFFVGSFDDLAVLARSELPPSDRAGRRTSGHWLCDASPVSGRSLVWDALRHLHGWPLAWLVFCAAQVMFQVSKALRGDMDSVDLALFALFLTGVVLGVSQAVRQERTRRQDRPGRQMETT